MINSHHLVHALAVAEHRNFARAAAAVHITQPALSRSIQALERELDARLFDRGRGGVQLTEYGQTLVNRARDVVGAIEEIEHEIEQLRGLGTGKLKVSLGPYPSALSGQLAVGRLLAAHPEIQCRLRVASFKEVAHDVAQGTSEVGIADLSVAAKYDLAAEGVTRRPLYFFARPEHPLLTRKNCALGDVLRYPWAAIRAPSRLSATFPADVGRAGRWDIETGEFVPALEVDAVFEFLVLARESDILVAATLTMAEQELRERTLAVVRFSPPWLHLDYGFISRPNHTFSPASSRFMDIVREIEVTLDEQETALREEYL